MAKADFKILVKLEVEIERDVSEYEQNLRCLKAKDIPKAFAKELCARIKDTLKETFAAQKWDSKKEKMVNIKPDTRVKKLKVKTSDFFGENK